MTETLFPYQDEGVEFLAGASHRILGDDPGLGKTAQAIRAADAVRAMRVLVLCPAVAKENWRREFTKFSAMRRKCVVLNGTNVHLPKDFDVVIANYDLLSRTDSSAAEVLHRPAWDALILDEAHYLKSHASNRTRAIYGPNCNGTGLVASARYVWPMSGTLAPNHAGELWPHLRALASTAILTPHGSPMSRIEFEDRFCVVVETIYGRSIKGSKNITELKARLTGLVLRRRKEDVLKDLPPLRFTDEPLSVSDDFVDPLGALNAQVYNDDVLLDQLKREAANVAAERRMTGELKAPAAADYIRNELEGNHRKLVVFAHHQGVIDTLMAKLAAFSPVKIDGRTPPAWRQKAVDAFQQDPNVRVFVGQIQAAGTAITLTASSDVVFVEASWVPSENYQAACRCHRIGQASGVLARFLYLPGSVDETIQRVLARKAKDLALLFG